MKGFSRQFAVLLLFSSVFFMPVPSQAAGYFFSRSLSIGSTGDDVKELQIILNQDISTRVSDTGPGSPGHETGYFGVLTRQAIVKFQEKYRDQVLIPSGLAFGTGFVGPATLKQLNSVSLSLESGGVATPGTAVSTQNSTADMNSVPPDNPNRENLDVFLSAVEKISEDRGLSPDRISLLKDQIIKDVAATTTDLLDSFIQIVEQSQIGRAIEKSPFKRALSSILSSFKSSFFPKKAQATSKTPFGGALLFSFFCTCSGNWLITLQPLPPTYVALLTYTPGSQANLSFNIPFTRQLLGKYNPEEGKCEIYVAVGCKEIPSEGMITPTVGSSP